jgi:hypothetical protein
MSDFRTSAASMLPAATRRRFIGVLSRLESSFDGERAAAGLLATRILREAGLTWDQIISPAAPMQERQPLPQANWRRDLEFCQSHRAELTQWESVFCCSLARRRSVTRKQEEMLARIAGDLRARGAA